MVVARRRRRAAARSSLVLLVASSVRACIDDNQALKAALSGGIEPCRVPMCRHRCSAAAAEGLCEAAAFGRARHLVDQPRLKSLLPTQQINDQANELASF